MQSTLRPKYLNNLQEDQDRLKGGPLTKPTLDEMLKMVSTTMRQQSRLNDHLALIKNLNTLDRAASRKKNIENEVPVGGAVSYRSGHYQIDKENFVGVAVLENQLLAETDSQDFMASFHPSKLTLPLIVRTRSNKARRDISEDESQRKFKEYEQLILQPNKSARNDLAANSALETIRFPTNDLYSRSNACELHLGNLNFISAEEREKQRKQARKLRTLSIPQKRATGKAYRKEILAQVQYQDAHINGPHGNTLQPKPQLPHIRIERMDCRNRSNSCSLQP